MAVSPITLIFTALDQTSGAVKNVVAGATSISFAYNNIQETIQSLQAKGAQAYQKLIGQNVELQQQLLSTQASLVSTNKVVSQGLEVTDPTKAIKALTEPVNEAIAQMRKGSLELVGVTSAELVPLFQITAQNSVVKKNVHL